MIKKVLLTVLCLALFCSVRYEATSGFPKAIKNMYTYEELSQMKKDLGNVKLDSKSRCTFTGTEYEVRTKDGRSVYISQDAKVRIGISAEDRKTIDSLVKSMCGENINYKILEDTSDGIKVSLQGMIWEYSGNKLTKGSTPKEE